MKKLKLMTIILGSILFTGAIGCGQDQEQPTPEGYKSDVTPHALPYTIACTNEKVAPEKACNTEFIQHAIDLWNEQTGLDLLKLVDNDQKPDMLFYVWDENTVSDELYVGTPDDVVPLPIQYGSGDTNVVVIAKNIGFGLGLPVSEDTESVMYPRAAFEMRGKVDFQSPKVTQAEIDFVLENLLP